MIAAAASGARPVNGVALTVVIIIFVLLLHPK